MNKQDLSIELESLSDLAWAAAEADDPVVLRRRIMNVVREIDKLQVQVERELQCP